MAAALLILLRNALPADGAMLLALSGCVIAALIFFGGGYMFRCQRDALSARAPCAASAEARERARATVRAKMLSTENTKVIPSEL